MMTSATQHHHTDEEVSERSLTRPVGRKIPVTLAIVTLLSAVLFIGLGSRTPVEFRTGTEADTIQLPVLVVDGLITGWVCTLLLATAAVISALRAWRVKRTPGWLIITFVGVAVFGFLTWAAAGATTHVIPVPGLLAGAMSLAVPLIFGSLGGVLSERVGVINIAIEGQLLAGAFTSALIASVTGQPVLGLIGAAVAGTLVSFVLAAFSIKYLVDQVIVGVVLNVLVLGITSFLFSQVMRADPATLNTPPRFERLRIPVLADIPLIGSALFNQTPIVYVMYVAVIGVFLGLFYTRWGLRLRAVGEHPQAADTVGIHVGGTRFWNVSAAGAIAGLGGAFFTLGSVGAFSPEMTAGAGFIALAAVIFGRWDPIRAAMAALLFGFASSLQGVLNAIGAPVPSEFMLMLPYAVTILAFAGFVGAVRGPAAAGKPYVKG